MAPKNLRVIAYVDTKSNKYNIKIKENAKMNGKSVSKVKRSSDIIAKKNYYHMQYLLDI